MTDQTFQVGDAAFPVMEINRTPGSDRLHRIPGNKKEICQRPGIEAGLIADGEVFVRMTWHRGQVYVSRSGRFLNLTVYGLRERKVISSGAYPILSLCRKNLLVHRELARAFIPNPHNLPCVNHKNGNKHDNSLDNLEWCTFSENTQHSYTVLGRKPPHTQLDDKCLRAIAILANNGVERRIIQEAFGVGISTVHGVLNGKTVRARKYVSGEYEVEE